MAETLKTENKLPLRGTLIILVTLLIIVSVTASIFGENQKISITARRIMNNIAARDYDNAYELLSESARKRMELRDFKAQMALLRLCLRAQYGANFIDTMKFTSRTKFWLPWIGESRRNVTVGIYRKEPGIVSEIKEMLFSPKTAGMEFQNLLVVVREKGRWLVDDINFDPKVYSQILAKNALMEKDIYKPTKNGFYLEGIVYDRVTISPENRQLYIDALTQALDELRKDAGIKGKPSDDLLKIIR